jgi:hypothetical protein
MDLVERKYCICVTSVMTRSKRRNILQKTKHPSGDYDMTKKSQEN